MKALKIIAVVLGALLVQSGIGLLVGSSLTGAGQQAFDSQLARQGLAGPVKGRVTAVDTGSSGQFYTVEFTDKDGDFRTGTGAIADNTRAPSVGDEVTVLYLLEDPDRIVIIDLDPAADFSTLGNALRIGGIVSLVLGALLLAAGILGLVLGRRRAAPAVTAAAGYSAAPSPTPVAGQSAAPPPAPVAGQSTAPQPAPAPGSVQEPPPSNYQPAPPGAAEPPPELGPPGPRPDYLSGPSGPPGPSASGGPPGPPPR